MLATNNINSENQCSPQTSCQINYDATVSSYMETTMEGNSNENTRLNSIKRFLTSIGDETSAVSSINGPSSLAKQIHGYRSAVTKYNLQNEPSEHSSLHFWKAHAEAFPAIFNLAKRFICTPATNVPSESTFSISSYLIRKERSRLSAANVSACMFLKVRMTDMCLCISSRAPKCYSSVSSTCFSLTLSESIKARLEVFLTYRINALVVKYCYNASSTNFYSSNRPVSLKLSTE